jgi:diguanylate cyclase (GGDEF)-like protein
MAPSMTDGVSRHDILNKAAIVAGFAAYLEGELEHLDPDELRAHVDRIGRAARELMALYAEARKPPALVDDGIDLEAAPERGPRPPPAGSPGHRLLLVEDDEDHVVLVRSLITTFRSAAPWEVVRAASLREAADLLEEVDPACLLVDLGLPDASGLHAVTQLRAIAPHHPIVVITATDDDDLSNRALRRGAQDYLVKGRLGADILERSINHAIERMAIEREYAAMAFRDTLTSLPNRSLLLDRMSHAIQRLARTQGMLAVGFLDLDRFKVVNDTLGHAAGDEVLREVARRLRAHVRSSDTVARLGGDEFVVLCEDVRSEAEAIAVIDALLEAIALPVKGPDGESIVVSISAGITTTTSADVGSEALLMEADAAMYTAKQSGRGRSHLAARRASPGTG